MDSMNNLNPVVVLNRIPSLEELAAELANRNVFNDSEDDLAPKRDYHEADTSDDDLPDYGIVAPKSSCSVKSTADFKSGLTEIVNNSLKLKEELAVIVRTKKDIDTMVNTTADQGQSSVLESELEIDGDSWLRLNDKLMLPSEILIDAHPGEDILDPSIKGKVFSRQQLTFENMENLTSASDTAVKKLSSDLLDEIIKSRLFILHFHRLTDKSAALRLLFRLMSVHEDQAFVVKCEDVLMSLLKSYPKEAAAIGCKEILEVLVNSGTTLSKLIPVPDLLAVAERVMDSKDQNVKREGTEKAQDVSANIQEHCLECILHILRYLVCNCRSKTLFLFNDLPVLIVALSTLALDKSLRTSMVSIQIREIIDELLQQFSADAWANQAANLAEYLSSVTDVPQNMAFVAHMFCFSDRGHHLQRLISFAMCHKLLGVEYPRGIEDVKPQAVLSFVKSMPRSIYDDLCILYNVILLVNLSVNHNVHQLDWKVIQELSMGVKKIANVIKNDNHGMDWIKIRDLATNISMKWTILANSQWKFQKSLFVDSETDDL